jgi:HD superfamily phosphohydrolase
MVLNYVEKSQEPPLNTREINSLYGRVSIDEPVLIELLNAPAVQRLQQINQYGINFYTTKRYSFTRYDHSVGVMVILRLFNLPLLEQIAGLLHDVSHTAFSHVADYLYKMGDKKHSYQDSIHEWYLQQTTIPAILKKYGIEVSDILHKKECFRALECELPNICADRIEYILQGMFLEGRATQAHIQKIIASLTWDSVEGWLFKDKEAALLLGTYSLQLCESHLGAAWNFYQNILAARLLDYALQHQLITSEQLHFGTDAEIWQILVTSPDREIQRFLNALLHGAPTLHATAVNAELHTRPKFRGVDPLIKTAKGLIPLTELDAEYATEYERVKEVMRKGWYISFTN